MRFVIVVKAEMFSTEGRLPKKESRDGGAIDVFVDGDEANMVIGAESADADEESATTRGAAFEL